MKLQVFLCLIIIISVTYAQTEQVLVNQCLGATIPGVPGDLCVRVKSKGCLELSGEILLNQLPVYTPRKMSIPAILQRIQNDNNEPIENRVVCQALQNSILGTLGPQCSTCVTIKSLKLTGNDLNFCGKLTLNCSEPIGERVFEIPCLNITNCRTFGCQNECGGNGVCGAVGVCQCRSGYYGPDCSIHMQDNCLNSNYFESACWSAQFTDCQNVNYKVTHSGVTEEVNDKVSALNTLPLVPCTKLTTDNLCEMCVEVDNIKMQDNKLLGCPTTTMNCQSVTKVVSYEIDCVTMATNMCIKNETSTDNNNTPEEKSADPSKIILLSMVGALVVVVAGLAIYFLVKRYRSTTSQEFSEVTEDQQPLNISSDEEDATKL